MRASILILTLVLIAGLPLQAGPKKYRRQASRHGPSVAVRVQSQFGGGAFYYGHRPARYRSAWAPRGHPCANYNKHSKYRKCMDKQRKKWRKHCRKHPWDCRAPYRRARPY